MADKHNMSIDHCDSKNSSYVYNDGYDWVKCSCGWTGGPVKAKDGVALYSTHVMQAVKEDK